MEPIDLNRIGGGDAPEDAAPGPDAQADFLRTLFGAAGLFFSLGGLALVPLGLLTWGAAWYAVAPVAGAGAFLSLFSRGWVRVAGVGLGSAAAALGVAFWVVMANRPPG